MAFFMRLYEDISLTYSLIKYVRILEQFYYFKKLKGFLIANKEIVKKIVVTSISIFNGDADYYEEYARESQLQYDVKPSKEYILFYDQYIEPRFYSRFDGPYKADPYLKNRLYSKREECNLHYVRIFLSNLWIKKSEKCEHNCAGGQLMRLCHCMRVFIDFSFIASNEDIKNISLGDNLCKYIHIKYVFLSK